MASRQGKRSLKDTAYSEIANLLIQEQLQPGEPLVEADLVDRLGLGRTPIREALLQLAKEGLVEMYPRRGAFVAKIGLKDVRELFEIREAIEGIAARSAAQTAEAEALKGFERRWEEAEGIKDPEERIRSFDAIGDELHEYILRVCDNKRIVQIINNYRLLLQRERHHAAAIPGRLEMSYREHRKILEAMLERDPEKAERMMRRHIASTAQTIAEVYRRS